jgi:hypothetical protein
MLSTCFRCGSQYSGYFCTNCRNLEEGQRHANKQVEAIQDLARQQAESAENAQRLQTLAVVALHAENARVADRIITELEKIQRLLQEQRITPEIADLEGYNFSKVESGDISLNLVDAAQGVISFVELPPKLRNKYETTVLREALMRGFMRRAVESIDLQKVSNWLIESAYTSGLNRWSGFRNEQILIIDNYRVGGELNICELNEVVQNDGYIVVDVPSFFINSETIVTQFRRGIDDYLKTENTAPKVHARYLQSLAKTQPKVVSAPDFNWQLWLVVLLLHGIGIYLLYVWGII